MTMLEKNYEEVIQATYFASRDDVISKKEQTCKENGFATIPAVTISPKSHR